MKYKTPAEAGIAAIPAVPVQKKKYTSNHKRTPRNERYMIRLKKGQTIEEYLVAAKAGRKSL